MHSLIFGAILVANSASAAKQKVKLKKDSGQALPAVTIVVVGRPAAQQRRGRNAESAVSTSPDLDFANPGDRDLHPKSASLYSSLADAFDSVTTGELEWSVQSFEATRINMSCDYRLELWDGQPHSKGVLTPSDATRQNLALKMAAGAMGASASSGRWQLVGCYDDEPVAHGKLKWSGTKALLKGDLTGALAADVVESSEDRAAFRAVSADIAAWRAAGAQAEPGSALAGFTPDSEGDFVSPITSDGDRAKWGKVLAAGALSGALTEVAISTIAGDQDGLLGKVVDKGSEMAGNAVASKITSKLPGDHYFASVCDLAAWMDAAYVHRSDYRELMMLATSAYPDFASDYRKCVVDGAIERRASGVVPPDL